MLERLNPYAIYELPEPILCPISSLSAEYLTTGGSLILTPDFDLYEFMIPYTSKGESYEDFWTLSNLRGPLLAFAFGLVILYQLFWKENALFKKKVKKEDDGLGELASKLKSAMLKKGKKISPKMENELREIDSMLDNVSNVGKNIG